MRSHPLRPSSNLKTVYTVVSVVLLAAYVLFGDGKNVVGIAIIAGSALTLACFFYYFRVTTRIKQQALNATLAYTSLENISFFVYLRSFAAAGQTYIKSNVGNWAERSLIGQHWDIEHSLTIALDSKGLLVAIGDKRKSVGAAKFSPSDEAWREKFSELATNARGIFVLPDDSEALRWEIEQIVRTPEFAAKTFFLMPPRRAGLLRRIWSFVAGSPKSRWRRAQEQLATIGISLPSYQDRGSIFRLYPDGAVSKQYPFSYLQEEALGLLIENAAAAQPLRQEKRWFDRWPITWTIFSPGAFLPTLLVVTIAVVIRLFLYQPFNIPSGSMKPSLLVGDYLFVSKISYGYGPFSLGGIGPAGGRVFAKAPMRGDIVVFRQPRDNSVDYIMRVIGLPGDEIQMRSGTLYINNGAVPKRRIGNFLSREGGGPPRNVPIYEETLPEGVKYTVLDSEQNGRFDNTSVYKVPAGHYFMMGDHRDNSLDSRMFLDVGYVPFENLIGRAEIIFFSAAFDDPNALRIVTPWRWPFDIRWRRIFSSIR